MMGEASTTSPTVEGTLRKATSRIAWPRVSRTPSRSCAAARSATPAPATVAMATPNTPSGNCISRKAKFSQVTARLSCEAKMVLTTMFTWVAESPTTAAAMSPAMRRMPGSAPAPRSRGRKRKPVARSEGHWASSCRSPPKSVPADQPITAARGPTPAAQSPSPTPMEPTLKRAGASAGAVKRPWALSMPMAAAASDTSSRKGIMIRASSAASSAWSPPKPGASTRTMGTANATPTRVTAPTTSSSRPATRLARRKASSTPRFWR